MTFAKGHANFKNQGLKAIPLLVENDSLTFIDFSDNPIPSFFQFHTFPNLRLLSIDNTNITSFKYAPSLPMLEEFTCRGTSLQSNQFLNLMALIVFGKNLKMVNGSPVEEKYIKIPDAIRGEYRKFLIDGYLIIKINPLKFLHSETRQRKSIFIDLTKFSETEESLQTIIENNNLNSQNSSSSGSSGHGHSRNHRRNMHDASNPDNNDTNTSSDNQENSKNSRKKRKHKDIANDDFVMPPPPPPSVQAQNSYNKNLRTQFNIMSNRVLTNTLDQRTSERGLNGQKHHRKRHSVTPTIPRFSGTKIKNKYVKEDPQLLDKEYRRRKSGTPQQGINGRNSENAIRAPPPSSFVSSAQMASSLPAGHRDKTMHGKVASSNDLYTLSKSTGEKRRKKKNTAPISQQANSNEQSNGQNNRHSNGQHIHSRKHSGGSNLNNLKDHRNGQNQFDSGKTGGEGEIQKNVIGTNQENSTVPTNLITDLPPVPRKRHMPRPSVNRLSAPINVPTIQQQNDPAQEASIEKSDQQNQIYPLQQQQIPTQQQQQIPQQQQKQVQQQQQKQVSQQQQQQQQIPQQKQIIPQQQQQQQQIAQQKQIIPQQQQQQIPQQQQQIAQQKQIIPQQQQQQQIPQQQQQIIPQQQQIPQQKQIIPQQQQQIPQQKPLPQQQQIQQQQQVSQPNPIPQQQSPQRQIYLPMAEHPIFQQSPIQTPQRQKRQPQPQQQTQQAPQQHTQYDQVQQQEKMEQQKLQQFHQVLQHPQQQNSSQQPKPAPTQSIQQQPQRQQPPISNPTNQIPPPPQPNHQIQQSKIYQITKASEPVKKVQNDSLHANNVEEEEEEEDTDNFAFENQNHNQTANNDQQPNQQVVLNVPRDLLSITGAPEFLSTNDSSEDIGNIQFLPSDYSHDSSDDDYDINNNDNDLLTLLEESDEISDCMRITRKPPPPVPAWNNSFMTALDDNK